MRNHRYPSKPDRDHLEQTWSQLVGRLVPLADQFGELKCAVEAAQAGRDPALAVRLAGGCTTSVEFIRSNLVQLAAALEPAEPTPRPNDLDDED